MLRVHTRVPARVLSRRRGVHEQISRIRSRESSRFIARGWLIVEINLASSRLSLFSLLSPFFVHRPPREFPRAMVEPIFGCVGEKVETRIERKANYGRRRERDIDAFENR